MRETKFSEWQNIVIEPRGRAIFRYNAECDEKYEMEIIDYDEVRKSMSAYNLIGELISGRDFLSTVEDGGIMDYDGILGKIYLCGYETNLGLSYCGLHQGDFQVDKKTWENLCEKYNIMVEWCNK